MIEEWRPTHSSDYEVSNLGRVRSWKPWRNTPLPRVLRVHPNPGGYARVRLDNKTCLVHTLVASAFLGPRPLGQECCHQDDDRMNAHVHNLKYGTHQQNVQECIMRGRRADIRGERNGYATLTARQVADIRALRPWMFLRELAPIFRVSPSAISRADRQTTWGHVG